MKFYDFFEKDFFENNKIKLLGVKAKDKEKSFEIHLEIDKPLPIHLFKKLLKGFSKLEKELRHYVISYNFKYLDNDFSNKELYLEYYRVILTDIKVDYDLLTLSNYNVDYEDGCYFLTLFNDKKIEDIVIEKAVKVFNEYGFMVKIIKNLVDKEAAKKIREEKALEETKVIIKNINEAEESREKEKKLEEISKKAKKRIPVYKDEIVEKIVNIPSTQSGIDECINTIGSNCFTIEGEIFNIESKKLPKSEIIQLSITDGTDSIKAKKFIKYDTDKELFSSLKIGDIVRITGNANFDLYARDVLLTISRIRYVGEVKKVERKDLSSEKRVELHLHTNMSALDALTPVSEYIDQALKWGHKAIAFTDHDGCYSFHEIMKHTKGKDIKPIYGVELGFVDEKKFNIAFTDEDINLKDATYVVFDIETTGFSNTYDRIIQIAARKVSQGQVIETFEEFVNPKMNIPAKITELTSIDNEKVAEALTIEDVLPRFINFIDGAILVAQNASFDVSHIYSNMNRLGIKINKKFPVIDTMQLARNFYANELKTFNLKSLARYFKVQQEHHHLADDDTRVTTEIFLQMLQTLYKHGIYNYKDINAHINLDEAYKHIIPSHINLLVLNQVGYKNLFKILSDSLTEHFHNETRLLKSVLNKYREGILVGSSCVNGEIFEIALNKEENELLEAMEYYDYIEVLPPQIYACSIHKDKYDDVDYLARAKDTIIRIINAAKKLNKIVVATGDCHYLNKEQKEFRDIYISAPQIGGGIHSLASCKETPYQHFRSTDEMLADFSFLDVNLAHEIVITNTNKIADMVEDIIPFKSGKDALYSPSDDEFSKSLKVASIKDDLIRLVYEKAYHDYGNPLPPFVQARIDKELNSIISNGYSPVYYMAYLLVDKSNSDGYVVGSRGSVGSSFVATMMKITEVNPLPPHYYCPNCHFSAFKLTQVEKEKYALNIEQQKLDEILQSVASGYDLPNKNCPCCNMPLKKDGQDIPFETFLGFAGDKTPDIDLNFSGDYQPRAHEYIRTLMGAEHAFRAGTITTVAENTAIGYVKGHFERKGLVKRGTEISRIAKKIEGVRRSTGQHPGGIVVVPSYKDIYDVTPIQYPADKTDNNWRTTHFEYHDFEDNLLKLDILGHDDPTTLRYMFDYVEAHPKEFPFKTPQEIPLDDPLIYRLFTEPEVIGLTKESLGTDTPTYAVPEFGTRFTMQMLAETKPKNFAELVKISGLSHGTDVWANNCRDLVLGSNPEFGAIPFSEIIGCRDDIMVYLIENGLEPKMAFDIMEFVRKGKAAKKDSVEKWTKFKEAMISKGIPKWYTWSCERIMYMFPKAHAVAYVLSALRITWFKIHKPLLFYSAYFSIRADQFEPDNMLVGVEKIKVRINEIQQMPKTTVKDEDLLNMYQVAFEMLKRGFKFYPIDIMKSHATQFLLEDGGLRLPFISIPGLGESVALDIMNKRNEKIFTSLQDIQNRTKINKTLFEKMIKLGAFGDLKQEEDQTKVGLFAF